MRLIEPPEPEAIRGDTVRRNAGFALAAQLGTAVFTAALTVYLVRALGPEEFGLFSLALSVVAVLLIPSDLGVSHSAGRFLAERFGDRAAAIAILGMTLRLRIISATLIASALFALAGPIANAYGTPELEWPLRGVAIALFGQSVMHFTRMVFVALRRTASGFTLVISESSVEFTATVALVALSGGATAAAFGRGIGYLFGAVLGVALLARLIGASPLRRTGRSPVARREFMSYAGVMLIVNGIFAVFSQVDVLLIGALLGPSAVGLFSAPVRLLMFVQYPAIALAQAVAPRMAQLGDERPPVEPLERAIRYITLFQMALAAFIAVWAEPIVQLMLGAEFEESTDVLRAMSLFVVMRGLSPVLALALNYVGEARRRIPFGIAAVAINIVLDLVLIPEIGIVGGAVGATVGFAVYMAAHVWLARRLLGLRLAPLGRTFLRTLIAAGAMAGVLVAVGGTDPGAVSWIIAPVAAAATYLGALRLLGEVSGAELRGAVTRPLQRLRR